MNQDWITHIHTHTRSTLMKWVVYTLSSMKKCKFRRFEVFFLHFAFILAANGYHRKEKSKVLFWLSFWNFSMNETPNLYSIVFNAMQCNANPPLNENHWQCTEMISSIWQTKTFLRCYYTTIDIPLSILHSISLLLLLLLLLCRMTCSVTVCFICNHCSFLDVHFCIWMDAELELMCCM